ncbi:MAG TPA: radical SAM protein, partial [Nordella sp.]|nr:radical SAM protein [Nordella sp.]
MTGRARHYMAASGPRLPAAHLLATEAGRHLFVADGSRLFDIEAGLFAEYDAALTGRDAGKVAQLLAQAGLGQAPLIDDVPLAPPPIHALSLAVAQKCNLGCTYCYAEQGAFGGAPKNMPQATALQAVDQLIGKAAPGAKLNLSFLGGEPLVNRPVLQATTRHAADLARQKGVPITFSITTNGTLVTEADADFFEEHGFAVTISLDGIGAAHDAQRPFRDGRGSFERIMRRIEPLLARQQ